MRSMHKNTVVSNQDKEKKRFITEIFYGSGHLQFLSKINQIYFNSYWKISHFLALRRNQYYLNRLKTENKRCKSFILICICNDDAINEC